MKKKATYKIYIPKLPYKKRGIRFLEKRIKIKHKIKINNEDNLKIFKNLAKEGIQKRKKVNQKKEDYL